jgi:hypothetical protein
LTVDSRRVADAVTEVGRAAGRRVLDQLGEPTSTPSSNGLATWQLSMPPLGGHAFQAEREASERKERVKCLEQSMF